jgi:hypothetical protein
MLVKSVSAETLFTNIAGHLTTIFTEYLHKIVTLARFGIGSLMMVQMDRNMLEQS